MKKNIITVLYCILLALIMASCDKCKRCDCPDGCTNCGCHKKHCDCQKGTPPPTPNNCSCSSDCVNCNCGKDKCKCPATDITGSWKGKDSKGYEVTLSVTETIAIVKYYETKSLLKIQPKQPELKTVTIDISSFDKTKLFKGKGDDGFEYSAEATDPKATSLKLKLPTEEVTLSR